jgi:hypothetical protein
LTASCSGLLKRAKLAFPSRDIMVVTAVPLRVVTSPLGAMLRTTPLRESHTRTAPPAPTATPVGVLKVAFPLGPFADPRVPFPANKEALPLRCSRRIMWLPESATSTMSTP